MAYTHIDPGREIEVSTRIYSGGDHTRTAELVSLPQSELEELEKASVAQEQAIFSKFAAIEAEWLKQAAETVAIREARQYLRVLPVEHTSNQWKKGPYDRYEISNMVYKMTYRLSEHTHYDRTRKESVIDAWYLTWNIYYNTVHNPNPDFTGSGWQIAGQDQKRFTDKAAMEKYLDGRIVAYAHLFTELSPPIPKDQKGRFCVNGVLLPGYTVEVPVEERAEELLSFLDDDPFPVGAPDPTGPETPQSDQFQEEESPMKQSFHTTPRNQSQGRELVPKAETARKGPKKLIHRKTAPAR